MVKILRITNDEVKGLRAEKRTCVRYGDSWKRIDAAIDALIYLKSRIVNEIGEDYF